MLEKVGDSEMDGGCSRRRRITSIGEFEDAIERYYEQDYGKWIFHGLANKNWKLRPFAGRVKFEKGVDSERKMLDEYKRRSRSLLRHSELDRPRNDFEWLALAQHHGIPTRLLDWSLNPYVALYFAVSKHSNRDGRLIALYAPGKMSKKQMKATGYDPFKTKRLRKYLPSALTPRITAQEACFTVHPKEIKRPLNRCYLDDYRYGMTRWCLEEYIVPKGKKKHMEYHLFRMGIHAGNLFPDIDGMARHMLWKYTVARRQSVDDDDEI